MNRFVPRVVQEAVRGAGDIAPGLARVPGVVLSADIAGFTALTEQLAKRGQAGIESIQEVLNKTFPALVGAIEECGGDVLKFAGDATIAWWSGTHGMESASAAATAAAARLHATLPDVQRAVGHPLGLRVSIGSGDAWVAILGGEDGRWEGFVGGEPFVTQSVLAPAIVAGSANAGRDRVHPGTGADETRLAHLLPPHVADAVRANRLGALAELRAVSVLFVSAPIEVQPQLDDMQRLVAAIQRTVGEFGGSIIQMLVDDKGEFVTIAAWGVPLASYGNDAERASLAAFELESRLRSLGASASIGVASGRVFSGLRGASQRAEYALIGNAVNRAARLMHHAKGGVRCDEATARTAGAVSFEECGEAALKGMGLVRMFAPQRKRRSSMRATGRLLGREQEMALLTRALDDAAIRTIIAVIEGDAGIGKSHLARALVSFARGADIAIAPGTADPLERDTPYFALRGPFQTIVGLDGVTDASERLRRVMAMMGDDAIRRQHAPLLGPFLDVALPETEATAAMSGRARADAMDELLLHLLVASHISRARLIVIDDAHWMDAASWRVIAQARKAVRGMCVIIVARPLDRALSDPRHKEVLGDDNTLRISLGALTDREIPGLVADTLGVGAIPDLLGKFVCARSGGHPLVAREITTALQQAGVIGRAAGDRATVDAALLETVALPDSLQGLAAARIDRLAVSEQAVLKAASVLGRDFSAEIVQALAGGDAQADLDVLTAQGILRNTGHAYAFTDAVTRDAAYELLPPTRRQELHAAAAAWYAQRHANDPAHFGRIARHYTEAHDTARAIVALERAGEHAVNTGALRESQALYRRLVTIARDGLGDGAKPHVPDASLGRWLRLLGVTEYGLGDLTLGRQHLETAVALLGDHVPRPGTRTRLMMLREIVRWGIRLALRRFTKPVANPRAPDLVPGLFTLAGIYNLAELPELSFYSSLRSYNVAERTGPTPEFLVALGPITYIVTLMKMIRLGERYMSEIRSVHSIVNRPLQFAEGMYAGCLAAAGQGLLTRARREVDEAISVYRQFGERRGLMSALAAKGTIDLHDGQGPASADIFGELRRIASDAGDSLTLSWAYGGLGIHAFRTGEYREAISLSMQSAAYAREANETVTYIAGRATAALAHVRLGELDPARELAGETARLIEAAPPFSVAFHNLQGFDCTAEVLETLWETDAARDPAAAHRAHAARLHTVNARLRSLGATFALCRHVATMHAGNEAWLLGKARRAFRLWRAAAGAEAGGRIYDAGRSHIEIARHLPAGDERSAHLRNAAMLLRRVTSQGELANARARGLDLPVVE